MVSDRTREWVVRWWRGEAGTAGRIASFVTAPLEAGFRCVVAARNAAYARRWLHVHRPRVPVVSVGNIAVGGTGKTPVAAWIVGRMRAGGRRPAIVLRGYGADEVTVHRELNPGVPVIVNADRTEGVEQAVQAGCDLVVLDDAFQHRRVARDLDIVLVAAERWVDAPRLMPRGAWRETPRALGRADLIIVTRKSAPADVAEAVGTACAESSAAPVARIHLRPAGLTTLAGSVMDPAALAEREVLAVTSLADPDLFVRQLEQFGATAESMAFPDHHEFDERDLASIVHRAAGRPVLCTRKEMVKLRPITRAVGMDTRLEMIAVMQEVVVESGGAVIDRALEQLLAPGTDLAQRGRECDSVVAPDRETR